MPRYDKFGDETNHWRYCERIWASDKISQEDREWVDKISVKSTIKFSEQKRLEQLYEVATGVKQYYPGPEDHFD